MTIREALERFEAVQGAFSKGALSVLLVVTDHARKLGLPLDPSRLVTGGGGQVLGLGQSAVQRILQKHGIEKNFASEGGRTNRGSLGLMRNYIELLNSLSKRNDFSIDEVEDQWISKVRYFLASKPISVSLDAAFGLVEFVRLVLAEAEMRQKRVPGSTVVGAVMQHLVGSKLSLCAPRAEVLHHSFSTADAGLGRAGDFLIEQTVIHVTSSATESLIEKCRHNLGSGLQPVIVTLAEKAALARGLIENGSLSGRVDLFHIEQFIALNVLEWSEFRTSDRQSQISRLVDKYNRIVDDTETDPGLKLKLD